MAARLTNATSVSGLRSVGSAWSGSTPGLMGLSWPVVSRGALNSIEHVENL